MKRIIKFVFKYTVGNLLSKIYFRFLRTEKWIPDFMRKPLFLNLFAKLYFTYKTDKENFGKEDYWQGAIEMLTNKIGDCEDWSIFFRKVLMAKYNATLFYVSYKDIKNELKAHISCVFDHGVIDNLGLFKIAKEDVFKVIAKKIINKLNKNGILYIYYIMDKDNKPVRY